ncbi:MAG: fibronectin type III domain-containing protein, partial [Paludibacteraceae bacterium]|nr:fibronectin type III domain-containing protein [Paludibacteraceae bacterium]
TVVVVTNAEGTSEILRDTVAGTQMQYTATGLKPSTAYQWTVYQTNGTVDTQTAGYKPFYTECVAVTPDYKTSFELIEGWRLVPGATSDTYKQTLCWTYGNAGTTTSWSSSFPYNIANTASAFYSYEGAYATKLYAYSTTMQNYIAMPEIEDVAAYDTLQVNFMMRPGIHNASGKISTTYAYYSSNDHYYAKTVIVGTMTDPADASTFVPIDTITYDGSFTTSDYATAANDYLFQKCKVVLTGAKGKYVAIMASLNRKGEPETKCTYDYMYVDNVSFSAIQYCETPEDLTSSEITATTAKLSWTAPEGAVEYILQVSTDPLFANDSAFVFNDTVKATSQVLTGLKSFTEYIWRIRTICGEDLGESEFSQNTGFRTARQPFFVETFGAADLDADWSFATNPAVLVFDSTDVELSGSNSTSYGWRRTNIGTNNYHYAVLFYSSSSATTTDYDYYWMISPVISLNDSMSAHLTFDMAMTGCSGTSTIAATPVQEAQMADDYTFIVAVSEDGGLTWTKNNILAIWNNTLESGNQLRDIPFAPANLRFDLAKYAGKNIRVAFYREADTYKSASPYSCAIHLDNIRINYYDAINGEATACQYQDIDELGFQLDGDTEDAGKKTLRRIEKAYDFDANTKGYRDSIYTLDVEYFEAPETIISDTICEGESYTDIDFHGKTRPGIYRHKLQSVEHCDSIITLYLNVTPIQRAEALEQTICPGESFMWNGKDYNRAGLYYDTLPSSLGCDSIETLVLSYYADEDTLNDLVRVAIDELPYTYQNPAHPYAPNQAPVVIAAGTAKGEYPYTIKVQGENCVAVMNLTVEVYDPHEGIEDIFGEDGEGAHKILYNDNLYIISNGKWYNAEGKLVDDPREISR